MTDPAGAAIGARHTGVRPDIQGLRAVAVGLVLVSHAGVSQLPGGGVGIDVFFVISGFLVTGLLTHEMENRGRLSLRRFYRRRAARLLPAAGVVLLAAAALTWWTATDTGRRVFGADIVAAAFSVVNWRLASRSVDPFVVDVDVSPVQHLWAVAVGGQFSLLWPLLILAAAWWWRRRRHARLRPVLALAIGLIVVLSFVWSIILVPNDPSTAFFATTTRLWELGVGALVAVGSTAWRRLPRAGSIVLGWLGLGAILASALVLSSAMPWPGHRALLPTLGTAAVIVAGVASSTGGASRLLAWRPAVWIGGLSYSLYLWHWPLLVAAMSVWGELGAKRGLLVVAASFVPAYLTHRFVENPIRRVGRNRRHSMAPGVGVALVGAVAGLVVALSVVPGLGKIVAALEGAGGTVLAQGGDTGTAGGDGTIESLVSVEWFVPSPTTAPKDLPDAYADGCQVGADSPDPVRCEYGDPASEVVVAVVGDSKILQWQSTLAEIAGAEGWRVISFTKSSCGFHGAVQELQGAAYTACTAWNDAVRAELDALSPDVVVTSQGEPYALSNPADPTSRTAAAMVDGLTTSWTALVEQGVEVIVILDNPGPATDGYQCVAENPGALAACAFDREEAVAASSAPTQVAAAERVPEVRLIDLEQSICPFAECVPVIGNVLLWRQGTHLTDTYARTLTGALSEQLVPLVERAA